MKRTFQIPVQGFVNNPHAWVKKAIAELELESGMNLLEASVTTFMDSYDWSEAEAIARFYNTFGYVNVELDGSRLSLVRA